MQMISNHNSTSWRAPTCACWAKIAATESADETEPDNIEADAGDSKGISSGNAASTKEEGGGDNTDLDTNVECADKEYSATKIMGDNDRKVSLNLHSIIWAHTNEQLVYV